MLGEADKGVEPPPWGVDDPPPLPLRHRCSGTPVLCCCCVLLAVVVGIAFCCCLLGLEDALSPWCGEEEALFGVWLSAAEAGVVVPLVGTRVGDVEPPSHVITAPLLATMSLLLLVLLLLGLDLVGDDLDPCC